MTDAVKLAMDLVQKNRELDNANAEIARLGGRLSALNSQYQRVNAELMSLKRENSRLEELNLALAGRMPAGEQSALAAEQQKLIIDLRDENAKLKEQLDKALQEGKRQAHPFRKRNYMDNPKKPGRRKGEGSFSHRNSPAAEQVTKHREAALESCPHCGCSDLQDRHRHSNWQIDLPEVVTDITRFDTESGWCPHCRRRVQSRHPEQLSQAAGAAGTCLGPRLLATAADLHARLGVPYAKIADLLGTMTGEPLTAGALCQNVLRLADLAEPAYRELIEQLRLAMVVHADETGWRIGTVNAWLWVFTNCETTVYLIRSGKGARGHEAVVQILGEIFEGVLVSDCFSAYDKDRLDEWLKQKCFAHLFKDLTAMKETARAAAAAFITETAGCLKDAVDLKKSKAKTDPEQYSRECAHVEQRLDSIIRNYADIEDEDAARFVARLAKQRRHLFTFLYHETVPPTNNHAERMIRPAVVARKTQGCNKSQAGADAHAILGSILVTEKQAGRSPVDCLAALVRKRASPAQ